MKKKRIASLLLAGVMTVSALTGCGGGDRNLETPHQKYPEKLRQSRKQTEALKKQRM